MGVCFFPRLLYCSVFLYWFFVLLSLLERRVSIDKDDYPNFVHQQSISVRVTPLDSNQNSLSNLISYPYYVYLFYDYCSSTKPSSEDHHQNQLVNDIDTTASQLITYNVNFVDSLRQNQKNYNQPLLVDCIAVAMNNSLQVYGIVSYLNLPKKTDYKIHQDYTLHYQGNTYNNQMVTYNYFEYVQVTSFSLPLSFRPSVQLSIQDAKYNLEYNVETSILHPLTRRYKLGVCAYVSNYNKLDEVKSWLAYYKMVGVDHVMLYTALELNKIKKGLSKYINSGFLRWYGFYWPLNRRHKFIQRSIQRAQVNSCYYRHRHEFEYLLMVDVDEYLLSKSNPFNISKSIDSYFTGSHDILIVESNMFASLKPVSRQDVLHAGSIFDVYNCFFDNKKTGRKKMIINTRSRGYYGIHDCSSCRFITINQEDLHIFHLKEKIPQNKVRRKTCGTDYSIYTSPLREVMKRFG